MSIGRSSALVLLALSSLVVSVGCGASAAPSAERGKVALDTAYLSSFAFLDRDSNAIEAPDSLLAPFFDHLRRLEEGGMWCADDCRDTDPDVLSVLHIGDSHIQAGILVQQVRTMMQNAFGNAGRGLVTPLRLARTNEPADYAIVSSSQWTAAKCTDRDPSFTPGMTGVAVRAENHDFSIFITVFDNKERPDYRFSSVTAYHSPSSPPLVCDRELSVDMGCPDTSRLWLSRIDLTELTDSVTLFPAKGGAGTPEYWGFSLENGHDGVLYHSIGVNGACYLHYSHIAEPLSCTAALSPELVIVSMGTNESSTSRFNADMMYRQMDDMLRPLREAHPHAIFMLTTPAQNFRRTRNGSVPNDNTVRARDVIASYARDNGMALWDMFAVCGGDKAAVEWHKAGLMARDRIHYTEEGYRLQGMLLFEALINSYYNLTAREDVAVD
ncbi:MAG: hypothetical protein K2L01_02625 [Rikenellaceae bacterium]|nr:hypothetical protein [Rikenellaceae bacterium]